MIISTFAFALMNVFVKSLSHLNVYQIVFFRSIGSLFFTIPFLLYKKIPILGNKKMLLILRGILGFIAMSLFFMSFKHLSMGSAVSIRYIAPFFAAIFALFFLQEKIKPFQWVCFAIAFLGVIILKGFDKNMDGLGLFYALLSSFFTGIVFFIIRKVGNQDHPVVLVNYFMVIAAILGGLLAIPDWKNPVGIEWLILVSLGVFGYFGQYYMTKAFQVSEVNQIAPLKYVEVIFSMIIGVIWLGETYTLVSILAVFLIIFGLVLNYLLKK